MNHTKLAWLAIPMFVCTTPLLALAGWVTCPGSTANTGTSSIRAVPEEYKGLCLRQATSTDPARVDARACRAGVELIYNADITGTEITATVYPYRCVGDGAVGVFTDCEKIMVDRDGDGARDDVAMNGDVITAKDATYDIPPQWLAFDVTNGASSTFELMIVCK